MTIAIVRRPIAVAAQALAEAGLSPVLARVYAARGICSAAELDHSLAALPTHASLLGIDEAAARLVRAITQRERIVIVADYDADGATACAVGVRGLRALGADVDFIVPNRFEFCYRLTPGIVAPSAEREPRGRGPAVDSFVPTRFELGYGLTPKIVALAAQREPSLLVTVDNGIAS